jgi:hypothetical protein
MSDKPAALSPSTRFTDVFVTDEQTGACWTAGKAEIREGLIRIEIARKPRSGEQVKPADQPKHTFTFLARDGAGRQRSFVNLVVDRDLTTGKVVVFR